MTADPFEQLREPTIPLAPRATFAADLRRRLAARLGVADQGRPPMPEIREYTPARYTSLLPMLSCPRAAEAVEWYVDVLDAVLMEPPMMMDDGRLGHAELRVGNTVFSVADEWPELDLVGPAETNSVSLMLYVPDARATYDRAVAKGATAQRPPEEAYGARRGSFRDPFGHRWNVGTALEPDDVPVEDIASRRYGDVGYATLNVPDGDRAARFFSALFGWDVRPGSVPGGFHIESITPPAGIATSPGDEPSTLLYFRVDDIEAAAEKVRELGGQVLAVTDYASGGNAECRDDQGLRFDLFRPRPGY
ncbi:MAG: VOC family protein [Acidimicrobiia bacterium]|nr:VOC family protein [Acidimicrobiia bacterium]